MVNHALIGVILVCKASSHALAKLLQVARPRHDLDERAVGGEHAPELGVVGRRERVDEAVDAVVGKGKVGDVADDPADVAPSARGDVDGVLGEVKANKAAVGPGLVGVYRAAYVLAHGAGEVPLAAAGVQHEPALPTALGLPARPRANARDEGHLELAEQHVHDGIVEPCFHDAPTALERLEIVVVDGFGVGNEVHRTLGRDVIAVPTLAA